MAQRTAFPKKFLSDLACVMTMRPYTPSSPILHSPAQAMAHVAPQAAPAKLPPQPQPAAPTVQARPADHGVRHGAMQKNFKLDPFRHRQAPSVSIAEDLHNVFDSPEANDNPQAMKLALMEAGHPLFYLSTARKCKPIRDALVRLDTTPACRDDARHLADEIRKGNWDSVSHLRYGTCTEDDPLHGTHIKDVLLYSFWRGDLNRAEFQTAMEQLNIDEQIRCSVDPEYTTKNGKIRFPKLPGETKLCRIFQSPGSNELTPEAARYIGQIQHVFDTAAPGQLPRKFDREAFIRELRKVPDNLQVFTRIDHVKGEVLAQNQELAWWAGELLHKNDAPVLGAEMSGDRIVGATVYGERGAGAHPGPMDNPELFEHYAFHSPSYGVLQAFMLTQTGVNDRLAFRAVAQPMMCLNAVSSETEVEMHSTMAHPVLAADVRSKATFADPHGVKPGPVFGGMGHDGAFHSPKISSFSPTTLRLATTTVPAFVDALAAGGSETARQIAKKIRAELGDLTFHQEPGHPCIELEICRILQGVSAEELLAQEKDAEMSMHSVMNKSREIQQFGNRLLKGLVKAEQEASAPMPLAQRKLEEIGNNPFRAPYGRQHNGEQYFSAGFTLLNDLFSDEKLAQYDFMMMQLNR